MMLTDPMLDAIEAGDDVWIVTSDHGKSAWYQYLDRALADAMCAHLNSLRYGPAAEVMLHRACDSQPKPQGAP